MSGPESMKPDDQLLDEFLAERGAVRETYRAMAQEQAPAHLDAAILNAAQAVVRPVPRLRRSRWQTPMAAAAVMVLSFGVFLQVQRDPAARKEVMAAPDRPAPEAAPAAIEARQDAAKAEVLTEADPGRDEAEAEQKQATAVAAKPRPAPRSDQRRAASADAAPPPPPAPSPPAMAMADAPAPPAALAPSEPEAAAVAADAAESSAAAGSLARESMQRQERFAAAAAPVSKSKRAPLTANLMGQSGAPAPVVSDAALAAAIEHWAQGCGAESVGLGMPTLWRGLAVASWTRQASGKQTQTTLLFAPDTTPEAITAALGSLAAKALLTSAQCTRPMLRELRQSADGWALVCECPAVVAD